jgi:hypothetical protein
LATDRSRHQSLIRRIHKKFNFCKVNTICIPKIKVISPFHKGRVKVNTICTPKIKVISPFHKGRVKVNTISTPKIKVIPQRESQGQHHLHTKDQGHSTIPQRESQRSNPYAHQKIKVIPPFLYKGKVNTT